MEFPSWVVERVVARQGRLHPHTQLHADKLAFVVIDMQNYFVMPGFPAAVPSAPSTVPTINKLCATVREAGGLVIWVQTSSVGSDTQLAVHYNETVTPERKYKRMENLHPASQGYQLYSTLDVKAADVRMEKICYSALVEGSSSLGKLLKSRNIETLLIGGTATNVCCDSTARDAVMQNFRVIMVDDALSAFTEHEHTWALHNWMLFFGDVLSAQEVATILLPAV